MSLRLATHDLVAGYPAAPKVLNDVSLQITAGHRMALLGANGSGKTTLLRCLSGSLEISSGVIETTDGTLEHTRAGLQKHRQQVQLVLQDPDDQLFAGDVASDVAFGPLNLGLAEDQVTARVDEACELLGISNLKDRPIQQLSYGQRKRVAIAGAVAMRPKVLLLDEPTAGLDPAGIQSMLETLKMLEEHGTAVVLSTHDVALAWEWADEIGIVCAGEVTVGPVSEMLTNYELLSRAALDRPWIVELLRLLNLQVTDWPRTTSEVAELLKHQR